jgi:hypothetical protein
VKTQRAADIAVGCFIALFGIFIIYASTFITGGAAHRLPPRTFPMTVGILLLLCGGGLALKSWSIREADLAISWPDREGFRTILVMLASLACYIALMNPLGLPVATYLVPETVKMADGDSDQPDYRGRLVRPVHSPVGALLSRGFPV